MDLGKQGQQRLTFKRYYWDGDFAGAYGMPFPNTLCRQRKTTWIYVTWNAATLYADRHECIQKIHAPAMLARPRTRVERCRGVDHLPGSRGRLGGTEGKWNVAIYASCFSAGGGGSWESHVSATARQRWRCIVVAHLEFCAPGHHLLEPHADTLNDREQDRTAYRAVPDLLGTATNSERSAREEACNDAVPWVLLLPYPLDRAVERAEETAPDAKVSAEHWCAHLDRCDGAHSPLAVRAVPEPLDAVPDGAADGLQDFVSAGTMSQGRW